MARVIYPAGASAFPAILIHPLATLQREPKLLRKHFRERQLIAIYPAEQITPTANFSRAIAVPSHDTNFRNAPAIDSKS